MHYFIINALVRLVTHGEVQPGFFIHDAFAVGKGGEAVFSVVGAHSARAEAAESHFAGGKMDDGVVDAASAKAATGSHLLCRLFIGGKQVEGEGACRGIDRLYGIVQGIIGEYGKNGAEDFFLHDGIPERDRVQVGRFDAESRWVSISSMGNFFLVDQAQDSVKMFFIDDFPIVFICQGIAAELESNLFFYFRQQPVLDRSVAVNIIGGDACLSAV